MKNLALIILSVLFPFCLLAQSGTVKGRLVDTAGVELSNATVSVLLKKDTSLVSYTLSDSKGSFAIKNLPYTDYVIFISFTGYELYTGSFSISADSRNSDIGLIMLWPEYKMLSRVIVAESPVRMNGDTISFKVNAFNSKPTATVEEVLKKIPGIQVQKDGSVKAMGEQVQKVYVDGKEFFGNDPKIATKNLTADMVDQIQVFDDMSEQARFTKIDDGSRTKSINIKLKKDKRKGDFGRVIAGTGSNSRYEGNFSLNHFRGDQRISLVGSANNTNKLNYSFSEFSGGQAGGSQFSGGGSGNAGMINASGSSQGGISRPISGGLNFNDTWGPKFDFRGSYFYSDNSNILEQHKFRRNTFPGDSSSEVNSFSNSLHGNRSHRVNLRGEYMVDTMNSLLYTVNLNKQQYEGSAVDTSYTYSSGREKYLAVKSNTARKESRNGINYFGELVYRKKFKRIGRTFTLGWRNGKGNNESNNHNRSPITTYDRNGNIVSEADLNQQSVQESENANNTISASYTEPIGNNKLFEINYAYSGSANISDKKSYDFNTGSGKYDLLNAQQTNYFDYDNTSNRAGVNFRHQVKKVSYQLGMGMQVTKLANKSVMAASGKDTTIRQRFTNLFPTANIAFAISRTKNIRLIYRGRTQAPGVAQLQDVPDVSNPLMIKTGNPSLKQEFANNININYNTFAVASQRFLSVSLNASYTANKIVNSIDTVNAVTIIYRPENMNGSFSGSGMTSLNLPVKRFKGMNLNLTNMIYLSHDANLVFKKKNLTTLLQVNQSAGLNYGKDKFDVSLSTAFVYNTVAYNFERSNNTRYFNHAYSVDFTYRFKNRLYFLTDLDYYISSGRTAGFNQDVLLWNMSIAKKFLQTNILEVKFTVYDILKQNNGINRVIGENYFEDVRANVVPRFFLVTIGYNLNHVAKNKDAVKDEPQPIGK
ncbi:MAG TPA: outer membrane beta-barrel family protein [Chitinophagaceae bacterium]|nr:outer membrane beta-barrel family protein [Chitinophagaceae bacterium]